MEEALRHIEAGRDWFAMWLGQVSATPDNSYSYKNSYPDGGDYSQDAWMPTPSIDPPSSITEPPVKDPSHAMTTAKAAKTVWDEFWKKHEAMHERMLKVETEGKKMARLNCERLKLTVSVIVYEWGWDEDKTPPISTKKLVCKADRAEIIMDYHKEVRQYDSYMNEWHLCHKFTDELYAESPGSSMPGSLSQSEVTLIPSLPCDVPPQSLSLPLPPSSPQPDLHMWRLRYIYPMEVRSPETPVKPPACFDVDNTNDGPDDGNTSSMMVSLGLGDEAADDDDAYMYTAVYTQWEKRWEKYNTWKVNDSAVMGWMKGALEPTQWLHVTAAKTAKEMWNLLYELYFVSRKGTQLHFHIWELWHQTWDESTTTMTQFIGKMLELRQCILNCGEDIGDRMLIQAIFMDKAINEKGKKAAGELVLISSGSGSQKGSNGGGKKSEKKPAKHSKPRLDNECFDCGAKGVWCGHPECSNPKCKGGGSKPQSGGSANIAVDRLKPLRDREVGKILMAVEGDELGAGLILDCGATSHMFCKKELFVEMVPEVLGEYVTVGGHNRVSVAVTLTNVLYVPELGHNLVTLGALHKAGASVASTKDGLVVMHGGEQLFKATLGGVGDALYLIEHIGRHEEKALVASSGSMRLWHRRMGHLSPSAIRAMSKQDMVRDLNLDAPLDYGHLCDSCMHGKSHKLPLPQASTSEYSKMELLVMDLTGPMSVLTWDGELYALVVLEVSCRYPVGKLLKSKDEVGRVVRDVVVLLERQSGQKAMRLRSDNGTEFVNTTMEAFFRRNGIIHKTMNLYLPEQNGMAERALAIYFEMVRDVRFIEDESLSNLATVDVCGVEASAEQVNELVDSALVRDLAPTAMSRSQPLTRLSPVTRIGEAHQVHPKKTTPSTPPPTTPTEDESVYLTPTTTPSLQDLIAKVHPTENTTDGVDVPARRSSKWVSLPARKTSSCIQKPVERYGFIAHGDEVLKVRKCLIANISTLEEPQSYEDVLRSPF
ncbi:hypothetical protein NP233_g12081 [Leucocoprinus birnbaumii]|uniref:Integrase catalytic domain-containing protein n=1 Tax=Leucocoprinus birnbaumii TaxID=56174 RepID=A0AAD5VF82_9AGAR|nr:hypothetical protein NP233_g12081 [Leucocoprinus birnbaumii]